MNPAFLGAVGRPGSNRRDAGRNAANDFHIHLEPQCGACACFFEPGDHIASLTMPHFNNSRGHVVLDGLTYPKDDLVVIEDQAYSYCRVDACSRCKYLPATATLHVDCLNLYAKLVTLPSKWYRLLRISISRSPWRRAGSLRIPPRRTRNVHLAMTRASAATGIPWLTDLPFPAADLVLEFASRPPSDLLRLCAVEELVSAMLLDDDERRLPPLGEVQYWSRGSPPVFGNSQPPALVLVTIDGLGIRQLERLASPTAPTTTATTTTAARTVDVYSLITPSECNVARFEFGVCRLQAMPYPSSPENWVIWDITTPIAPENCTRLLPKTPQDYRTVEKRLITVSIAQCTGLTFFMSNGISRAVHRHSKQHPTAEDTFRRLPDKVREAVVWVYVPFAPGDEVTALGVRYNRYLHDRYRACFEDCCYVFETSLGGAFTVGPYHPERETAVSLPADATLVFDVLLDPVVSCIAVHPKAEPREPFPTLMPRTSAFEQGACHSSARLEDVSCIWVYRDAATGVFGGLVVEYRNGHRRALGSCRAGIDRVERCEELGDLYFQVTWDGRWPSSKVAVGSAPAIAEGEKRWKPLVESRTLDVWFSSRGMSMFLRRDGQDGHPAA